MLILGTLVRRSPRPSAGTWRQAGEPEAVTLREVGARAGVTRSAPYRDFAEKDVLLAAVGAEAWDELAATFRAVAREAPDDTDSRDAVRDALVAILGVGRDRSHTYRVMFTKTPAGSRRSPKRPAGRKSRTLPSSRWRWGRTTPGATADCRSREPTA